MDAVGRGREKLGWTKIEMYFTLGALSISLGISPPQKWVLVRVCTRCSHLCMHRKTLHDPYTLYSISALVEMRNRTLLYLWFNQLETRHSEFIYHRQISENIHAFPIVLQSACQSECRMLVRSFFSSLCPYGVTVAGSRMKPKKKYFYWKFNCFSLTLNKINFQFRDHWTCFWFLTAL